MCCGCARGYSLCNAMCTCMSHPDQCVLRRHTAVEVVTSLHVTGPLMSYVHAAAFSVRAADTYSIAAAGLNSKSCSSHYPLSLRPRFLTVRCASLCASYPPPFPRVTHHTTRRRKTKSKVTTCLPAPKPCHPRPGPCALHPSPKLTCTPLPRALLPHTRWPTRFVCSRHSPYAHLLHHPLRPPRRLSLISLALAAVL